ncbi:MAG: cyclic nucleotide-binding domain-containing protein [Anaerolineae bacterium]|nr:cyclic nucleotide-binding domain-containing protein [Anaerolineae bacterium]
MAEERTAVAELLSQSDVSIFKGIDPPTLQPLVDKMELQVYQDGELIFNIGDAGDAMYLVETGRVRVYLPDEQGNELITFRHYNPAQTVGELGLLDTRPRSATAAAESDAPGASVRVYKLKRDDFIAFLEESPAVGLAMMRDLTSRIRYTTQFLERLMDSINWLLAGDYERALQDVAVTSADSEIQNLIVACLQMIRSVQDRAMPGPPGR